MEHTPLVLIDGRPSLLPSGDTIKPEAMPPSSGKNIDGGSASSVYLPAQSVDGGDVNG